MEFGAKLINFISNYTIRIQFFNAIIQVNNTNLICVIQNSVSSDT